MATDHSATNLFWPWLMAGLALFFSGCDDSPQFEPNAVLLAEREIAAELRERIAGVMGELFGSPDQPLVPATLRSVVDPDQVTQAAGPVASETPGVTRGLYRRHCARCHGITGDGAGPTALYQYPYPRDFRPGVFKWKSTKRGAAPTDADLHAVLLGGVPGTAMPSFALLKPAERESLVAQVKLLAMRGQFERRLIDYVFEEFDFDPDTGEAGQGGELSLDDEATRELVQELLAEIAEDWLEASSQVVVVASPSDLDSADRVAAGRALFHDAKRAGCVKCHGEGGRGGVVFGEYDDWDKRRKSFIDGASSIAAEADTLRERIASRPEVGADQLQERLRRIELKLDRQQALGETLLPPRVAEPRNLASVALRGGHTPEALYNRLHEGVAGTPMPGVGDALSEDEIWSLVAYVRSLVWLPRQAAETEALAKQ